MPRISVVIPLFNKEKYVGRTLLSVLNQTFQDYEIIVVDDGSTDSSVAELKKIQDPRVRLIQQQNYGVSVARNVGVIHSNSEIIAFLDADDEWTSSFLSIIWALVEKYPEAGAFVLDYERMVFPKQEKNGNSKITDGIISNYFKKSLTRQIRISSSSIAVRKEIFCKLKGFKKGVCWGEDQDLWARLAVNSPISFSTFKGAIIHDTNDPVSRIEKRNAITWEHPFLETSLLLLTEGKIPDDIKKDFCEYLAKLQIISASLNLLCGNQEKARIQLKKCHTRLFLLNKLWCLLWTKMPKMILNKFKETVFIMGEMGIECILNQRDFKETYLVFFKYWIYQRSKTEI